MIIPQFDAPGNIAAKAGPISMPPPRTGGKGTRAQLTVSRHVFVADSVAAARDTLRDDVQRALEEWKRVNPERFKGYLPKSGRAEDITFDQAFDSGLFIGGDPDTVFRQLREVHEQSGGFGTLLWSWARIGRRRRRASARWTFHPRGRAAPLRASLVRLFEPGQLGFEFPFASGPSRSSLERRHSRAGWSAPRRS